MNSIIQSNKISSVRRSRSSAIVHYTRLNLLKKRGFDFSNSSFLTLTIANAGISSNSSKVHNAKSRLIKYLQRHYNLRYYVSVSEYQERGVLHYHLILFNVPYIPHRVIAKFWGLGFVKINQIKAHNSNGAFYYLLKYLSDGSKSQKHLRFVWSRSFQTDGWFSFNSSIYVYYSRSYNNLVFDMPAPVLEFYLPSFWVSASIDRRIFSYRFLSALLDILARSFYLRNVRGFDYLLERYIYNFLC